MSSDSYGPYDLLDDLDLTGPSTKHHVRLQSFMLDICERLSDVLPNVALAGLTAARAFRAGSIDSAALEAARVACWDFLGKQSCHFDDPAVCSVRAVICTLFPTSDDAFSTLHLFLDFAGGASIPDSELLASLRAHFSPLHRGSC